MSGRNLIDFMSGALSGILIHVEPFNSLWNMAV